MKTQLFYFSVILAFTAWGADTLKSASYQSYEFNLCGGGSSDTLSSATYKQRFSSFPNLGSGLINSTNYKSSLGFAHFLSDSAAAVQPDVNPPTNSRNSISKLAIAGRFTLHRTMLLIRIIAYFF